MMEKRKARLRAFVKGQNETLDIEEIGVRLFGMPERLSGFRLTIVADLHIVRLARFHDRILEAVYRTRPGCILIAGDSVDQRTESVAPLEAFFRSLSRMAPTIAVLGNNDCATFRAAPLRDVYAASGITLLENETRLLPVGGVPIRITGLTDPLSLKLGIHEERPKPQDPTPMPISEALRPEPEKGETPPSILLMHQPQLARAYAHLAPSLIVAGHAHGGQFRVPGIGGLYAPGQGVLPRYTSGLYRMGTAQMVVSRGLGNHGFPVRLNNRPHVPVVVLEAGAPA